MKMSVIIGGVIGGITGMIVGVLIGHKGASKEFQDIAANEAERANRLEERLHDEIDKRRKTVSLVNTELNSVSLYQSREPDSYDVETDISEKRSFTHCKEFTPKEYKDLDPSDTCEITYYPGDDVYVDEREEPMLKNDIRLTLGDDVIEEIMSTNESEKFFYNEELNIGYGIVIQHGMSYEKDILGMDPDEFE